MASRCARSKGPVPDQPAMGLSQVPPGPACVWVAASNRQVNGGSQARRSTSASSEPGMSSVSMEATSARIPSTSRASARA